MRTRWGCDQPGELLKLHELLFEPFDTSSSVEQMVKVIAANHRIDHATICRFRTRHRTALSELFLSVLDLCAQANMVHPAVIGIDSTKIAAQRLRN